MKTATIVFNWIIFLAIIVAAYLLFTLPDFSNFRIPARGVMPGSLALFFGLSLAFTWVEVLKLGKHKPFNCVKCLTGWFSLGLAFAFHVEFWYLYLFAGLFIGAMYSAIKMRWL